MATVTTAIHICQRFTAIRIFDISDLLECRQ
jgi:hypothetical protein